LSLSLRSNSQRQDAARPLLLLAVQRPPSLSQYAAGFSKQRKARFSENSFRGVTILQWCKRFDATLGLCALSALDDYSE
jgi:hypothetical protein